MATVTKPIALDESINTTEQTPRNVADVLAQELARIAENILPPSAEDIAYDNTESGLTATNVQDAIDEVISSQADVIADTMADLTENKTATVTDGVADFETIDGSLVKLLVVEIEPSQSGYTQEDVFVVGKNWADIIQGNCTTNGTITSDTTRLCNSDYIPVKAGQTFTISATSLTQKTQQGYFRLFATKGTTNVRRSDSWTNLPFSVTVQEGEYFLQLVFRNSDNSDIEPSDANIQLELGNTATTFEPYHGKTYTTTFGQSITAGGTLDFLTGELTTGGSTISLTPQTVKALVGENHIQASTGDVLECKYSMLINGDDLEMLLS